MRLWEDAASCRCRRQFLKDMGEAGGFIQIGQNARVLLGYKTPINGFYSWEEIDFRSICVNVLLDYSSVRD